MAAPQEIRYYMPISALTFTGTRTTTSDSLGSTRTAWSSSVEIVTIADRSAMRIASIKAGALRNTDAALAFTPDGRLTSATSESTGTAAALVKGVAAAAVTGIAALWPAVTPMADALGRSTSAAGDLFGAMTEERGWDSSMTAMPEPSGRDPIEDAYQQEHPHEAAMRTLAAARAVDAELAHMAALRAATSDASHAALRAVRHHEAVRDAARNELARLDQHFKAWRATKITTATETHNQSVTLDELVDAAPGFGDGAITWQGTPPAWAERLWERLGVMATILDHADSRDTPPSLGANGPTGGVWIRDQHPVTISVFARIPGGGPWAARPVSSEAVLVFDARSPSHLVRFRTSVWSKRKVAITMSSDGALTGYSHSSTGSASEIGGALGEVPASVAAALEQAATIREQRQALTDADRSAALERAKNEVALKENELTLAGLHATTSDYAELERLKQQVSVLEQRRTIAEATGESDAVAGEIAGLKQQLEAVETRRSLDTEIAVGDLKLATDRLEAIAALLDALKPDDDGT